jgi:hypothetical protein
MEKTATWRAAGIGIANIMWMTLLQTLAQIPLMFIGLFLIVLAVFFVWLAGRRRGRDRPGVV